MIALNISVAALAIIPTVLRHIHECATAIRACITLLPLCIRLPDCLLWLRIRLLIRLQVLRLQGRANHEPDNKTNDACENHDYQPESTVLATTFCVVVHPDCQENPHYEYYSVNQAHGSKEHVLQHFLYPPSAGGKSTNRL